jgi:hypothetical protein
MKKYKHYLLLLILTPNLATRAQEDSLFRKFQHQLTLNLGVKQYWFQGGIIGRNVFQEVNYFVIKKSKKGIIEPLLGVSINHSIAKSGEFFQAINSKFNYSYFSVKLGLNLKLSKRIIVTTNFGIPVIRWFDSNVLGGVSSNKLFPSATQVVENQYGAYYQVKTVGVFEMNISKRMGKHLSLNPGLRYFIVQTSPNIPFYKIRQTLYLQMGVSYTF